MRPAIDRRCVYTHAHAQSLALFLSVSPNRAPAGSVAVCAKCATWWFIGNRYADAGCCVKYVVTWTTVLNGTCWTLGAAAFGRQVAPSCALLRCMRSVKAPCHACNPSHAPCWCWCKTWREKRLMAVTGCGMCSAIIGGWLADQPVH